MNEATDEAIMDGDDSSSSTKRRRVVAAETTSAPPPADSETDRSGGGGGDAVLLLEDAFAAVLRHAAGTIGVRGLGRTSACSSALAKLVAGSDCAAFWQELFASTAEKTVDREGEGEKASSVPTVHRCFTHPSELIIERAGGGYRQAMRCLLSDKCSGSECDATADKANPITLRRLCDKCAAAATDDDDAAFVVVTKSDAVRCYELSADDLDELPSASLLRRRGEPEVSVILEGDARRRAASSLGKNGHHRNDGGDLPLERPSRCPWADAIPVDIDCVLFREEQAPPPQQQQQQDNNAEQEGNASSTDGLYRKDPRQHTTMLEYDEMRGTPLSETHLRMYVRNRPSSSSSSTGGGGGDDASSTPVIKQLLCRKRLNALQAERYTWMLVEMEADEESGLAEPWGRPPWGGEEQRSGAVMNYYLAPANEDNALVPPAGGWIGGGPGMTCTHGKDLSLEELVG